MGSIAIGEDSDATAAGAVALGGDNAVAGSNGANATGDDSIAIGSASESNGDGSVSIGGDRDNDNSGAVASANLSTAVGSDAQATGTLSTAIGANSSANAANTSAFGQNARATSNAATALGTDAEATGFRSTALGRQAESTGNFTLAVGTFARATATSTTALGQAALATADNATALGTGAQATNNATIAVGVGAIANASQSMALGRNAAAQFVSSTAIGTGAQATRINQMMLGQSTTTYTAPGIDSAASDAVQTGTLFVVTSDANGNLATGAVSADSLAAVGGTIADGSLTAAAFSEGSVTGAALADAAVSSTHLEDGAVTAAKLGLANTTFVAADGATASDDCDALRDELLQTVGPAVVVLGPGTYACGAEPLVVPEQVHLRGSGRTVTTISGVGGGALGVMELGNRAALSNLGVHHLGGTNGATAVRVPAGAQGVEVTDVHLRGGGDHAAGHAMLVDGGEVLVRVSTLEGGVGNDGRATIVYSQITASGASGYGAYRCVGSYDGEFFPLNRDCAW